MNILMDDNLLILASKSPRRKYLLEQAGLKFNIIPAGFDESSIAFIEPELYVKKLAEAKALEISKKYSEKWIIGADTVVIADNQILGKPTSKDHAYSMIKMLSGKTHQVFTGYCICCKSVNYSILNCVITDVTFKKLSEKEINWYISTDEPFDKAGAYAIQGLGTFLVRKINGSYTNVVGLPVCEVVEHLLEKGVIKLING